MTLLGTRARFNPMKPGGGGSKIIGTIAKTNNQNDIPLQIQLTFQQLDLPTPGITIL